MSTQLVVFIIIRLYSGFATFIALPMFKGFGANRSANALIGFGHELLELLR